MTIHAFARRYAGPVAAALLLTGLIGIADPANASPKATGCPGGFPTYQVSDLIATGYGADFLDLVDVNNDGVVCAKPLADRQEEKYCATHVCTVDIMGFIDNKAARF